MGINLAKVKVEMDAAIDHVDSEVSKTIDRIVVFVLAMYINNTPVDTGTARRSWQSSRGSSIGVPDPSPYASGWIWSHLDYIEALDDGWSQQAPAGMTALVLASLPAFSDSL